MKLHIKQTRKGFTLVELLVVIAIIAALAAMATPVIMKQKKKADMTTSTNNAKQIFYLMVEFDGDFGEFPSDDSAEDIEDNGLTLGSSSSNDYFRQFIAGGYTQSEEIFFAKSKDTKKPDNVITSSSALEDGEVGFAYLSNQSTSDNSARPLVMAPMNEGEQTFDADPYDSKCVVLRIDGSVKQLRLNSNDEAILSGSQTLFDDGEDTVWGDDGFETGDLQHAVVK